MNCVLDEFTNCDHCSIIDGSEAGCKISDGYDCALLAEATPDCDCKPMCEDEEYEFTTSVASFPNSFAVSAYHIQGWPTNNVTYIERK